MEEYKITTDVRWADLDPNFHMLHSRYYDLGAYCRMEFLVAHGLTPKRMSELNIGPILFREECIFKKEIVFGDAIVVNLRVQKATEDFSRWTMVHEITKNGGTIAAFITCDGAWMDTKARKLAVPPTDLFEMLNSAPKTTDFFIIKKK